MSEIIKQKASLTIDDLNQSRIKPQIPSSLGLKLSKHKSKNSSMVSAKVTDYRKVIASLKRIPHLNKSLKFTFFFFLFSQKNTKPLMEKRRRERINRSLEELKDLILDQVNHNVSSNHFKHRNSTKRPKT